jgi:hypothetical protein
LAAAPSHRIVDERAKQAVPGSDARVANADGEVLALQALPELLWRRGNQVHL